MMRVAFTVLVTLLIGACATKTIEPRTSGDLRLRIVALEGWRLDARSRWERENGVSSIFTEGELFNESDRTAKVPKIRLAAYNVAGTEVFHWTVVPDAETLPPDGRTSFNARLESPPPDIREMRLEPTLAD